MTVVIPTHDRVGYLAEAVASALDQDDAVSEVVVVDDGSVDGTGDWLRSMPDPRLRWQRVEVAGGGSAARNLALADCRTPFVLFLDDDDRLRPGVLRRLAAALDARPRAAGAAGAFVRFGSLTGPARDLHPRVPMTVPVWREELFGWNMPPAVLLWRRSVVAAIGGFDATLRRCEDRDLNLRAYPRPFALVPVVAADYRVHPAQVRTDQEADTHRLVVERFVAGLPERHRGAGQAVLDARRHFDAGLERYVAGDFKAGARHLAATVRRAPALAASPILGPWLTGLVAKTAVGAVLPSATAAMLQQRVRARRC
ncbi:MAG: glycosyltransferase family 2 protein [Acidimicrobiia bacterium]